jgi:hypothetical protein
LSEKALHRLVRVELNLLERLDDAEASSRIAVTFSSASEDASSW